MQTPYFTEGQTEPRDPTETTVEKEKSAQKPRGEEDEGQMSALIQKGPLDSTGSTGQQNEQNGGFSGVRKILHPAEALDSARHTAELIMKDAMDALIRTKQRLMEILPSLIPSHAADDATKVVEDVEKAMLENTGVAAHPGGSDDTKTSDEKGSGGVSLKESGSITRSVTKSNPDRQSVRKKIFFAKL